MKRQPHELRTIAQALGVTDIYQRSMADLEQQISLKQGALHKPTLELPPRPEYDSRLMTKAPARKSEPNEIVDLLEGHIKLGLKLRFDDERWYMACSNRTDEGTIRMPLRHVLNCADKVLRG